MEKIRNNRAKVNENYNKKISFGLSLNIKIEDYYKIISKYSKYLSSVYFSLPFGEEFHTRNKVKEEYSQDNAKEKLLNILNLFKDNGIKLEAVINQYHIDINKLKKSLVELDRFVNVDSICCLDEYVDVINRHYEGKMYLISSFNNGSFKKINDDTYEKYNMIVLGKEYMREPEKIKKIQNNGLDIKLLVNNGCAFNCKSCREGYRECVRTFEKNLENFTPEELYAIQSFFPWELEELFHELKDSNIVKEIKLSSRPSTYEYIDNCLESYIYNVSPRKYIDKNINNYHLWGRQANLIQFFQYFDLKRIEKMKRNLWERRK